MPFRAELVRIDGKRIDKDIKDEQQADQIKEELTNGTFVVSEVKEEIKKRNPKVAYTTSALQQDASNKLYFSSRKTMQIAQKLYEGVDIGSGLTGLITYMRTDSTRLSEVFVNQTRNFILQEYGKEYVGRYHTQTSKNAQDAHEAIRPTSIENTPEKIKAYLSNDEYKLYKMIYYRTLASLMASSQYQALTVKIVNGQYEFQSTGRKQ